MNNKLPFDYDLIKTDYEVNDEDDDEMVILKRAVEKLKPVEKKIFLTYVELGSYAATARQFNVTAPTARTYLDTIIMKLLNIVKENENTERLQQKTLREIEEREIDKKRRTSKRNVKN